MTTTEYEEITLLDGRITGIRVPSADHGDAPLIVYLHGGGGSALEPVMAGSSQFARAALNGFTGLFSLNRPDYGGSESLGFAGDVDEGFFAASAERLGDAIAELWDRYRKESRGVIVHGSSVGGAIALVLAAQWSAARARGEERWPLLGVAGTDVGHAPRPQVSAYWYGTEVVDVVENAVTPGMDFGPAWALPEIPITDHGPFRIPRAEMLELVGGWPRNAQRVAASIGVPVFWRVSEFDPLWQTDDRRVAEFVEALRTSSPYVDGGVLRGATHGAFLGPMREAYGFQVLSFFDFCRVASRVPEVLAKRGG
ncbi:hypothetical protein GTY23_38805 [Streptomyces sp. SID5998]|nr:hypothetical protein [Streptomyces sp. SID5998]